METREVLPDKLVFQNCIKTIFCCTLRRSGTVFTIRFFDCSSRSWLFLMFSSLQAQLALCKFVRYIQLVVCAHASDCRASALS